MKRLLALALLVGATCFGQQAVLNTFNAGELSPHMDARVDFEKYNSGLRTMENFICLPYGGALKRPGTQYIDNTKSNGIARLIPFSVGVDQSYVLELGDEYMRFYQDGVRLTNEIVTVWDETDVFEVQVSQFADTMYMVHPDYPPQKLQRTTTTPDFSIAEVEYAWPPVLDENLTDTTITPSATTGTVTLTASDSIFTTNHIGSVWVLNSPNDQNQVETNLTVGTGTTDSIRIEGAWNFRTSGSSPYTGTIYIEVSLDNGSTWGVFREYENATSAGVNYDRDGEETDTGVLYRLRYDVSAEGNTIAYLKSEEPYINGTVEITGFNSATVVTGTVVSALGSTNAVKTWSEAAFSAERGYPRTVEFYENRLFYGGTDYQVNTIWASKTDLYDNFKTGDLDDSGLRLSINSDNIIEWMLGRNQLFIGTLGDEWILSGGDSSTPVTPTSVLARRQTSFGSKDGIDALIASDSIMYLQRQGRKLREFEYSFEADQYRSQDVTMIAEHITEGDILQIAEQQQPEPVVWCIRGDGQLIGMTYSKAQNVYGWHRHVTDGEFESIAVIPTEGEDRIYVVVKRTINGATVRYVEWFRPVDWTIDDGTDDDAWFVDSGLDYDGGASVDIDSLSVDTNGYVTITATHSVTNGDHILLSGGTNGLEDIVYGVTNATATNFVLTVAGTNAMWQFTPSSITGSGSTDSRLNGTYNLSAYNEGRPQYINTESPNAKNSYVAGGWTITATGGGNPTNALMIATGTSYLPAKSGYTVFGPLGETAPTFSWTDPSATSFTEVKNTFTNVSHLAGETLNIFADGGVVPDATVTTNGVLTTTEYYNRVIAGLPYTAKLSPMYIEVVNQNMLSYGRYKNNYKVHFRVKDSGQFNYGSSEATVYPVSVRLPDLTAGSPVPFYSGDRGPISIDTPANSQPEIWVTSGEPLPLELLSMVIWTDIKEYD